MMPSTSKTRLPKSKKPFSKPEQRWQMKQPTRNWLDLPSDKIQEQKSQKHPTGNQKRKSKKPFSKPKQRWQVKQPKRNWLDLPSDIMANVLSRIGAKDILENAQKVCTTWRKICKDPALWRVIDMRIFDDPCTTRHGFRMMCMHAVDRSQGQLVDISIEELCNDELLLYIADRASQLRRLCIAYGCVYASWVQALKKFPLLVELSVHITYISKEGIETAGRYCPLLTTLIVNDKVFRHEHLDDDVEDESIFDDFALAIARSLPQLKHLEIIGSHISNVGLKAILDGCRHLESLDLRKCLNIDLNGDLGKRCKEQIKYLRFPKDSLDDCKYFYGHDDEYLHLGYSDYDDDDGYFGYSDYDDFTAYDAFGVYDDDDDDDDDEEELIDGLNEMMFFKAMIL